MNWKVNPLLVYIAKAVAGAVIVLILSKIFNYPDIAWCLISVELVLSPDNAEAIPLALTRMKANLSGGIVSLFCLLLGQPDVYTLSLAMILTILVCHMFKLMAGSRSAIAAVVIILLHKGGIGYSLWGTALERVISVIAGCALGLIITYAFHGNFGRETQAVPVGDE